MNILPASEGLAAALAVLRDGGIVIHATETCYGIACDLTNPAAVQRLFAVKKRPLSQPVSALFPSVDAASSFVSFSPRALALAAKHLPGPLTLVLPKHGEAPLWVTADGRGGDPMIGVRISSHLLASELARSFGKPIATTSANIHGAANPYSLADLESQFGHEKLQPDLILDGGTLPQAPPSTVLEVVDDRMRVLRQGALRLD